MSRSTRLFQPLSPTRAFCTGNLRQQPRRFRCESNFHHHHHQLCLLSTRPSTYPPLLLRTAHQCSSNDTLNPSCNVLRTVTCSLSLSSCSLSVPPPPFNSFASGVLSAFSSSAVSPTSPYLFRNINGSEPNYDTFYRWQRASYPIDDGAAGSPGDGGSAAVTVVLLGWLGGQPRYLEKYSKLYASRGFNVVTFAVPVSDVLRYDLGKKMEGRIERLANDLVAWMMQSEKKDEKERRLVFHTFSNTGWLVFGTIIGYWQNRPDIMKNIKGVIVDSGGEPELNPKVWAAGFGTAMLKKRGSASNTMAVVGEADSLTGVYKPQDKEPSKSEVLLLFLLEQLFSFLLQLPDVKRKLVVTISRLSENVVCPQLYLYSTADKVIPFRSVESYAEEQRHRGRKVWAVNFETSPHVDHYRTFPDLYSAKVDNFLDECLDPVKQLVG